MTARQPIATAPTDGSKVMIYWTDGDGVMNESIGRFDRDDGAWWVFTDSRTKKKVEPSSWRPPSSDGDDR